jgi:mono/diheme cytochrome c family protein
LLRHSVSRNSRESGRPVHAVVDVKIETTVIAGSSAFTDDDTEIEGSMKPAALSIAVALFLASPPAPAEEGQKFTPEQISAGAEIYAVNCSPCHGARMQDPGSAFNLRRFPHDQRERFISSIVRGKNQMPPWGDFFKPDQLEALWAYVMAGER